MKIKFLTYGCKANQYETEVIRQNIGSEDRESRGGPETYIINSCTVTAKIDSEIRKKIRNLKKRGKKVILTGCLTGRKGASEITSLADAVIGNRDKFDFSKYLLPFTRGEAGEFLLKKFTGRTRAFVKVQGGCDRYCSYCVVPFVRGNVLKSRPVDEAAREISLLADNGYKEIVITGVNLGLYGKEKGDRGGLLKLLKKAAALKREFRLRLSSIGPAELHNDIIDFAAGSGGKICPHFHMSLQSADPVMLKKMNRNYTPDKFEKKAAYITSEIKGAGLTTDVIAGFPGEGDKEFRNTLEAIKSLPLSRLHVFPYSGRPGTAAAAMENKVPETVKKERVKELIKLGREKEKEFINRNAGEERVMLVQEGDKGGRLYGYTENYIYTSIKSVKGVENKFLRVKILKAGKKEAEAEIASFVT